MAPPTPTPTPTLALVAFALLTLAILASYTSLPIIPGSFIVKESPRNIIHRSPALIAWVAEHFIDRSRIRRARVHASWIHRDRDSLIVPAEQ